MALSLELLYSQIDDLTADAEAAQQRIASLEAENARLREALWECARKADLLRRSCCADDGIGDAARAALEPTPEHQEQR